LAHSSAVIDFRNQTITISDLLEIPLQQKIHKDNFVRAKESSCVPPKSEVILPVTCAKKFNNQEVLLSSVPGEQFRGFAIANSIGRVTKNETVCRLLNHSDKCLVICANQKIAQITSFDDSYQCLLVSDTAVPNVADSAENPQPQVDEVTLNKFADEYQFNINSKLPPDLRMKLLRVLFKRKEAFARSIDDLKSYNKHEFEVKLKSTKPLIQKQFRHKPEHARIL
jgi:hypothetical protein